MAKQEPVSVIVIDAALRKLRSGYIYVGVLSFFISLAQLILPIYSTQVYDRVLSSRSTDTLLMLTIISIAGLGVYGFLEFYRQRVFFFLGERLSRTLGKETLSAAVAQAAGRSDASVGQSLRDLNDLRNFVSSSTFGIPLEVLFSPLFLLVLWMIHPDYGLIAFTAAFLLVVFGIAMEMAARSPISKGNDVISRATNDAGSALRHADVMTAMGMVPAFLARWERAQSRSFTLLNDANARTRMVASASRILRYSMQILTLALGADLVLRNQITSGSLIAASIIMGRFLMPFDHMLEGWKHWMLAAGSYRRVRALLLEAQNHPRQTGMAIPDARGVLKIERLTYFAPGRDKAVVRNIAFTLPPGQCLGIIGPSASGKSSLIKLILGILTPNYGAALMDGQNVLNWDKEAFGEVVGYLPQTVALFDGTVRENISRWRSSSAEEVIAAARAASVHDMIGNLSHGYETQVGENNPSLSGGQRQRLALARALFGRPVLLVLDEPNSNLDYAGEQALLQALQAEKKRGCTIVMVVQRPSAVAICDKLLVMQDGVMTHFGEREEVLKDVAPGGAPTATTLLQRGQQSA